MTLKCSEDSVTGRIQVKERLLPLWFGRRSSTSSKRPAEMNSVITALNEGKTGGHKGRHLVPGTEPDMHNQTRLQDPAWPLEAIFTPLPSQIYFVNLLIVAVLTSQPAC
ncbi:unnamed protein product [Rangifer tarandus platyrhynchus]|uniref:Uncharacterized protein n=1 Tax=Rangifer tarandus platyrhynchus TaxID=3082113 RepID=A0ABN8YDM1_RANTA|nr:unnamed protein product [Rangifer tarandus platyrhynchus]